MKLRTALSPRLAGVVAAIAFFATGAAAPAAAADLATVLANDPQFSDFVLQLRLTNMWPSVARMQNITIFAPTNEAIEKVPDWNVRLIDALTTSASFGSSLFSYQALLRSTMIKGNHPVSDFAGKAQPVHSLGVTVYWVDGQGGSAIRVAEKRPAPQEMGMDPVLVHTGLLGAPISADNGVVYPIDAVIR